MRHNLVAATRDPIGVEGGQNLYSFVLNSPITAVDILGLVKDGDLCTKEGATVYGDPEPSSTYETSGVYDGKCWCQCYYTRTFYIAPAFTCRKILETGSLQYKRNIKKEASTKLSCYFHDTSAVAG